MMADEVRPVYGPIFPSAMTQRDQVDDQGHPANAESGESGPRRPFLSVWFQCCHAYARLYRDDAGTKYEGRCPRCGARAQALIGPGGTSQRVFRAI